MIGNDEMSKKHTTDFLIKKLKQYSSVASVSGEEEDFIRELKQDFPLIEGESWREVRVGDKPYYLFLKSNNNNVPYFFTVHTDRVRYQGKKVVNSISYNKRTRIIKGQLDDIIGIVILRILKRMGYSLNILFTTVEEPLRSWTQVKEVMDIYKLRPISIDIDVFDSVPSNGSFTLRSRDAAGMMLPPLVNDLRTCADKLNLIYTKDAQGWAMVEPGMLAGKMGIPVGAHIGVPITHYHSNHEETSIDCVYNIIQLISNFLSNFSEFINYRSTFNK
jgi:hypothetical protein